MKAGIKSKYTAPNGIIRDARQAEAEKTSRLRALRLAKEATDREAAAHIAATTPPKAVRRGSQVPRRSNEA